jgi:isoquinoline 1-oxidoreductase beta subunit
MIGPVEILPVLRSDSADRDLGLASVEAWPAAGGGLLVGMAEPEFAGAAPLRRKVKTIFIRIGAGARRSNSGATLLLPYVSLEPEARRCVRALVSAELAVPEECIAVGSLEEERDRLIDLSRQAEHGLQACAALARSLLVAAAAEAWCVPDHRCRIAAGLIVGPGHGQILQPGDVAADAALIDIPDAVWLQSGRTLSLCGASPPPAQPGHQLSLRATHRHPLHT